MDTLSIPNPLHSLDDKWDLYYHLPQDNNWELSGYTVIINSIEHVEQLLELNAHIHDTIIRNCMLFVMRTGITPMWEDPNNRNGGCFSYKVSNKYVPNVWRNLMYALCGESICMSKEQSKEVNGITISPKKKFCIIKIWLKTTNLQDPSIISAIPNLSKQGCLFKKHEPEF
jgi:hypothetical protein|tara:strand:- start:42 stop:554 length:513 start_codon:yes stop_codon:yes gene_type:complete